MDVMEATESRDMLRDLRGHVERMARFPRLTPVSPDAELSELAQDSVVSVRFAPLDAMPYTHALSVNMARGHEPVVYAVRMRRL